MFVIASLLLGLISDLLCGHTGLRFEKARELCRRGKTDLVGNVRQGDGRCAQQIDCRRCANALDVLTNTHPKAFFAYLVEGCT